MIPVIFFDHSHDLVEAISLTTLIRDGKIRAFKRAGGWAYIGKDRIRRLDTMGFGRMGRENHESDLYHMQESHF